MASIERECELALINAVSAASVTSYTSEREGGRLLPNLTAKASITNELLGPFTGVFGLSATLAYTSRADSVSRAGFDHEFSTIVQQLYRSPSLASYMTSHSNLTIYKASINSEIGSIIATNRTWKREIAISIQATVTPPLIPFYGLALWLKADAGVMLSGSNVTAWADQSGNGNNATAYNDTQLVENALNSKPAISFDGVASFATFPISLSTETNRTIFIVGKYNDLSRGQEGFLALVFGGSLDRGYVFRESRTDATYYYTPSQIAAPTLTSVGNYHIVTVKHNFVGDSTMGINGSFGQGGQCDLSEINQGDIARRGYDQEYASVNIAEIIIYNQALTTQKLQQVEQYLNTKYAIY